ncbi:MAG: DUF4013 domain-containing protein [Anaerolineales bacterium]
MRFGLALTFLFQDAQWFRKVFRVAVCLLIPVLGAFLAKGWALEVCRNVIRGSDRKLPDVHFRRHAGDGLAVCGLFLACSLPVFLWLGVGVIADALLSVAAADTVAVDVLWWGYEIAFLALGAACGVWAVAGIGRLAEDGSFRRAVGIRGAVAVVRSAPAAYGFTALSWLGFGLLAASGIALCGIGICFTSAFAAASAFHAAGQARRLAAGKPLPADLPPQV